jgi:pimeloyl-ACP methyl ester carboxylesterase
MIDPRVEPRLLPIAHTSKARHFDSIVRDGVIKPTHCTVFDRDVAYFFYGGLFYHSSLEGSRDGWLDYFLAAGFDVYFVDRPAHGRSPNSRAYGELGAPATTEAIAGFTAESRQYPGGGGAATKEVAQHTASSEAGPTVSSAMLQENLGELLDRIGAAIIVTHPAGGPSGWLAMAARPNLVKAVLAIEPAMGVTDNLAPLITFQPALAQGERIETVQLPAEGEGLQPCRLQAADKVRTVPAYKGKNGGRYDQEWNDLAQYYQYHPTELEEVLRRIESFRAKVRE